MFRKSIALAFALSAMLTLASCGKNNVNNETESNIVDGISSVVDDVITEPMGTDKETVTKAPETTGKDTETVFPTTDGAESATRYKKMK